MTGCPSVQTIASRLAGSRWLMQPCCYRKVWVRQRLGLEATALHPTGSGQGSEAGLR